MARTLCFGSISGYKKSLLWNFTRCSLLNTKKTILVSQRFKMQHHMLIWTWRWKRELLLPQEQNDLANLAARLLSVAPTDKMDGWQWGDVSCQSYSPLIQNFVFKTKDLQMMNLNLNGMDGWQIRWIFLTGGPYIIACQSEIHWFGGMFHCRRFFVNSVGWMKRQSITFLPRVDWQWQYGRVSARGVTSNQFLLLLSKI